MFTEEAEIILVHRSCGAGCLHCPFSKNVVYNTIDIDTLLEQVIESKSRLVILSGGEPLEHPNFLQLLERLSGIRKLFRIASGGHRSVFQFLRQLQQMPFFTGFSLGTDVMIAERNSNPMFREQWKNNLQLLSSKGINYSITITMGHEFNINNVMEDLSKLKCDPKFIMISEKEGETYSSFFRKNFEEVIKKFFPNKLIKLGYKNRW